MLKRKLLPFMLVLSLGLVACGGNETATTEGQGQEPAPGQTEVVENKVDTQAPAGEKDQEQFINTWYVEDPTTLNSAINSDASSYKLLLNLVEPLVRQVENVETGELNTEPGAAESWEVSEDGLTWTFKIREGMKWENGDPLTAKDFEFGMEKALDPVTGAGGLGWLLDCIEGYGTEAVNDSITAVDDYTLEIKVTQPTPYFIQLMSSRPSLPINQNAYEEFGEAYGAEAANFVGCGPFTITDWIHQTDIKLVKNPEYWDAEHVYLENVDWRIINEETTRMNAFLNGEIDSVGTNAAEWQQQFEMKDDVLHSIINRPSVDFMFFNTEKSPYNNAKVRLAFSLALNREEAIQAVFDGVGQPGYGFVMHGITTDDGEEYRKVVEGPILGLQGQYADPKALLEEGLKEEGIDPASFVATLDFGGTGEQTKEIGDYMINSFKNSLGVDLKVNLNEWSAFNDQIQNGNFEIGYMAWFADYNDPYHMLSIMLGDTDGLHTGWANEEYDTLVKEGINSDDPAERLAKYEAAETILSEEAPVIPIFYGVSNSYRYDYVYGWQLSEFSTQGLKNQFTSGR